ncbi:MAG: ribonuclease III [[Clostridium] spiroforme]|uniref:Ribonuclease 3 n=1 Tax=Thomasclavelia spiroformis TaxID=29348 RepID=A0A943EJR8_9FIRM|nr:MULTISPECIES: ribonuclease III [Thomasclavelia]MBS5589078.1 ribonuclease III [Thomasclavelia spiroformis]
MELEEFLETMEIPYHEIEIFKQAFTHTSYANENKLKNHDYERLEFLGDAVLQYHVSRYLFDLYPTMPEGRLTKLRSKLVREESLARFARELNLGAYIYLGAGEINNGGRDRDSVLADIFEAFMGAICHDCGMEYVDMMLKKTIYRHINDVNYDDITDFKTKLQELIQADQRKTVTYELLSATGPSNNPIFEMAVKMDDMILGTGVGSSKKRAEQQAAKDALTKLAK